MKLAPIADKIALKVKDNRDQPEWEQDLWEELQWVDDLDTKQVDILFGMVVTRWDRARHVATPAVADLSASDCKTPEDWARWARERVEYEDPYGYERSRY